MEFTNATLGRTVLAACEDLARARGLETVVHHGHSCLDLMTLRAGLDTLPQGFLQGPASSERSSRRCAAR